MRTPSFCTATAVAVAFFTAGTGAFPQYSTASTTASSSGTNSTAASNGTLVASNPDTFWMESIRAGNNSDFLGTSPFLTLNLTNSSSYTVFRNVKDYGAVGDGVTDDTAAIQRAINDGNRCQSGCGGQTVKPALVYFPQGSYAISKTLLMYVDTQIVGDAVDLPTLVATEDIEGDYVVDGYPFTDSTVSTTNFYIQVRNLKIDTTAVDVKSNITALNWAVAQGTSLYNLEIHMSNYSSHVGIMENGGSTGGGSGTFIGDITFYGGAKGFVLSNQQFALRGFTFIGCNVGLDIDHVFLTTLQDFTFENCGVGINASTWDSVGSLNVIDAKASSSGSVIVAANNGVAEGSILIDNLQYSDVGNVAVSTAGLVLLEGGNGTVDTWRQGNSYINNQAEGYKNGNLTKTPRSAALIDDSGDYFTKSRPQYQEYAVSDFSSVKTFGAKGDGETDDTEAINQALLANAGSKITYFPAGTYIVTSTVYVPPNSRVVGEVWSAISASGEMFKDEANPAVVVQIGKQGERGVAEFSDIIFTVADILPGAILTEINMAAPEQGDVGFWDVHYRIGGAEGSAVHTQCGGTPGECKAAFLLLHVTAWGGGYFENVWGWTADHDLDAQYNQTISTGRGYLIESTSAAWFVGSASEHHTLYHYTLHNARNVFFNLIQVETPYWQPTEEVQWTSNALYNDPSFDHCAEDDLQCKMAWGLRVEGGSYIFAYGAGFWLFFNQNSEDCANTDSGNCQDNMIELTGTPQNLYLYNMNVKSVKNMILLDGNVAATREDNDGSWGGVIANYIIGEGAAAVANLTASAGNYSCSTGL